ncbi:MAG: hypothetical protein HY684_02170 [Chloroflexi bacterium]|nr:hypothetical protein [Chloroflexota bacterium]
MASSARATSPRDLLSVRPSLDAINERAITEGWSDGLPIIPPTERRVDAMLRALGRSGEDVVATLAPRNGQATLEKIAANAVMAGCRPEQFSIVVAAVEALADERFNLHAVQATTGPAGPCLIVNGPVRRSARMNCGRGCLGPGNQANATIGRAIRLVLLNIGGGAPDTVDKATHGFPGKYTFCFGEDEENSPWPPLHVDRGLSPTDSAVTVLAANGVMNVVTTVLTRPWDMLLWVANAMSYMGSNNVVTAAGEWMVVLTSGHARLLSQQGMSKADAQRHIYDKAGFPTSQMPQMMRAHRQSRIRVGDMTKPCQRPEHILLVVAGGAEPHHIAVVPTWGDSYAATRRVPVPAYAVAEN